MATYYFRNATATWGTASNWSLSSGGPADGAIPGNGDDVIFDSNSRATCTLNTNRNCRTLSFTNWTGTIDFNNVFLRIYGSIDCGDALFSITNPGSWQMGGTNGVLNGQIIRTNGKVSHPVIGISGVSLNDYSSYELQRYGVKVSVDEGIYVVKVTSDGAASKAGIQQGDVIVKLDGKDITTYKSFLTALYSHKAGDKVKVVVNRSGTEKTIEVTLQEK